MTEVTNELIAEMLGYRWWIKRWKDTPVRGLFRKEPDFNRPWHLWNGTDECVIAGDYLRYIPDFFTPDGLAEVKADIERLGWQMTIHLWDQQEGKPRWVVDMWSRSWEGIYTGSGQTEAEALLEAYAAAKKEGSR